MNDTAIGFVLLGIALIVVLGVVFVIASRGGPAVETPKPPPGVHMPGPSFLPVVLSVGAALLAAGFAFRGDWALANPFLAIPGDDHLHVGKSPGQRRHRTQGEMESLLLRQPTQAE